MLWMFDFTYDDEGSREGILLSIDEVMADLPGNISQETIDKAIIKIRSKLYDDIGGTFGLGRADLLCSFALFDDNPDRINTLEEEFKKITPDIIQKTINEYLTTSNRTILTVNPLLAKNDKKQ